MAIQYGFIFYKIFKQLAQKEFLHIEEGMFEDTLCIKRNGDTS